MTTVAVTSAVFDTLKRALKGRGLTYRDVAEHLGLSESTIKKTFASRNCSLHRLADLAELAGVPLPELFEISTRPAIRRVRLSEAQQRWLLAHRKALAVFWKLTVERLSPADLRQRYGLAETDLFPILAQLDDQGLIEVLPGDRVRPLYGDLVKWADEGPLLDELNRRWSASLVDEALSAEGGLFRLHELHIRPETAAQLRHELGGWLDQSLRGARYEQVTTAKTDRVVVRILVAAAEGGFVPALDT